MEDLTPQKKTIKLLADNLMENFHDLGIKYGFLNRVKSSNHEEIIQYLNQEIVLISSLH